MIILELATYAEVEVVGKEKFDMAAIQQLLLSREKTSNKKLTVIFISMILGAVGKHLLKNKCSNCVASSVM